MYAKVEGWAFRLKLWGRGEKPGDPDFPDERNFRVLNGRREALFTHSQTLAQAELERKSAGMAGGADLVDLDWKTFSSSYDTLPGQQSGNRLVRQGTLLLTCRQTGGMIL
ncbi:hypothetical protein [Planctomicrobium piriforme]|uniref:hypothetical protein n=1 Tax=Planctomicrobium piriforme TaxID=1576369 RepID=UPI000B82548A|nr:hypothetical protein [Planctomicrobium piriforme]